MSNKRVELQEQGKKVSPYISFESFVKAWKNVFGGPRGKGQKCFLTKAIPIFYEEYLNSDYANVYEFLHRK